MKFDADKKKDALIMLVLVVIIALVVDFSVLGVLDLMILALALIWIILTLRKWSKKSD